MRKSASIPAKPRSGPRRDGQWNRSDPGTGPPRRPRIERPDVGEPPFPVYYLLHGLSDDYTIWQRRTRIEWYVRELPLIVVMPDGFRFPMNHDYWVPLRVSGSDFQPRQGPGVFVFGRLAPGSVGVGGGGAFREVGSRPDVLRAEVRAVTERTKRTLLTCRGRFHRRALRQVAGLGLSDP